MSPPRAFLFPRREFPHGRHGRSPRARARGRRSVVDAGDQLFAPAARARGGSSGRGARRSPPRAGRAPCRPARPLPRRGRPRPRCRSVHCAASLIGTISPLAVSVSSSGWMTRKSSSGSRRRRRRSLCERIAALSRRVPRRRQSRPAATIRCRNCCVRGSRGAEKICSGGPCSRIDALVEEADAVGDVAREAHLVRGDHHRHPAGGELADHLEHLGDELRVERARHLVEQHQLGLHRERAHDRDALLLAAREPVGVLVALVGEAEAARAARARAPRPRRASGRAPRAARASRCAARVMCGKRLYAWKTIPIRRRTRFASTPRRGDLLAVDDDPARVDRLDQVDAAQQRRLARARRADQADDLVLGDGEVDAAQHLELRRTTCGRPRATSSVGHAATPAACRRRRSRTISQSVKRASGIVIATKSTRRREVRRVVERRVRRRSAPG